jgi:hypothetical protein
MHAWMRRAALALACAAIAALALATAAQASPLDPSYVQIVPNQSSRDGAVPVLIVIHVTTDPEASSGPSFYDKPGIKDLQKLGRWFADPRSEVSSHVANDGDGNDARYVSDGRKAWTEVAFNSVGLSIEQIGSVDFDRATWMARPAQLADTARWIAHWHRRWGIPIHRAEVSGSTVIKAGVATHKQLGRAGGNHSDPGPGYPLGYVLRLARTFAGA